ncbi:MAG: metallophosphoesterase [Archangium sp.]|nr:metallophosphoesterase [Archangium sp.]
MIAWLTDVEGRWDKLVSFTAANPHVSLVDGALRLAEGVTFVFGGDAIDRGAHGRRFVSLLLAARRAYGDRVVLLAGNRDINKLRLVTELGGQPRPSAPATSNRAELLRWTLANTMGAGKAFEFRAAELREAGEPAHDDAVVDSYLADLAPGGELRAYLNASRLGFRVGSTLFLHGGVTVENFLQTPKADPARDVDAWLATLDRFYRDELAVFEAGRRPDALIAYQAQGPDKLNQGSVVYARPTDELGNPQLPPVEIVARLLENGIRRVVVGHTPSGDCPAILRDGGFELVLADNSYGRLEHGSQLSFTDEVTEVRAVTQLDGGAQANLRFTLEREQSGPIGLRDLEGRLVKARLETGDYLLFRGLPNYQVEQVATSAEALSARPLFAAREPLTSPSPAGTR